MRVYLSVDMEGVAGVAHPAQTYFDREGVTDRTDYDRSRGLMAAESNAAIAAAFDAGADGVTVNDSHWQMRNLRAEDLDPRARLITGDKPFSMTQGIGPEGDGDGFAAAAFIGYHAGAGHPTGVIGHTYAGIVMEARVNGVPHNESGLNALRLGHHGVPVVMVSGDDALAGEIEQLLPWAERVVVKRAQASLVADSLSPQLARGLIADGMSRAIRRLAEMPPYRPQGSMRLEVDLRLPIMADYCAVMPTVDRIGPRSVAAEPPDAEALFATFLAIVRMAGIPGLSGAEQMTDRGTRIERQPAGAAVAPMNAEQQRWLRAMMARFATGVSVVAARHGPLLAGMTANAIASISIDPPLMMASISGKSETHGAIVGSHSFAISVLSAAQRSLADCFAQSTTAAKLQRFCDAAWHDAETGSPILDGAIAFFDCRLVAQHAGGDHTMFVGEIVAAGFEEEADPLIWFGSAYRTLEADAP